MPVFFTRVEIIIAVAVATGFLFPGDAQAIQRHLPLEGITTHQMGHLFFLISMVVLIFMISGKNLSGQKGWRMIQYSAFFFILWNLDAILGHFLDNQIYAVKLEHVSVMEAQIVFDEEYPFIYYLYYLLKLDHLLAVPAMFLFYRGLSALLDGHGQTGPEKGMP